MKVLTLSNTYEPLGLIPWEKAITLVYSGKVKILSEYTEEIRSPSTRMRIPSVVVFHNSRRNRVKSVRFSRKNVWIRDEGRCQYCANHVSINDFTLDHVLPKTRGGKTSWTNVVTCCVSCNQRKGDKPLATCGLKLLKPVVKPAILPYIHDVEYYFNFDSKMPESWRFWLGAST